MSTGSSRVRSALRRGRRFVRSLAGQDFYPKLDLSCETAFLGDEGAGWVLAPAYLPTDAVVYAAGVGENISFDLAMIERYGVQVHAFDPTPRSIAWAKAQHVPEAFHLHEWGLADFDGEVDFHPPENPDHVSHTLLNREKASGPVVRVPVCRLTSTMKALGHDRVDVLKMDIEGAEYAVVNDLSESGLRPGQLLVEFHHRFHEVGLRKTRTAVRQLREMGYRLFSISDLGEEWSYIHESRLISG